MAANLIFYVTDEMPGDWSQSSDYTFVNEQSHQRLYIAMRPDQETLIICLDDEVYDETNQSLGKALSLAREVMGRYPVGV